MEHTVLILALCATTGILIYLKIKMPAIKGKIGERIVATTLSFLPKDEFIVLNNLTFRIGNRTTQIDHIVVSIHGIFVIETKNYKGWIYGHANSEYWTQNFFGNKYSFYNPILQNRNHIKYLISKFDVLKERAQHIYPVVVFLRAGNMQLSGDCHHVMWRSQLNGYLRSATQTVMAMDECRNIASQLMAEKLEGKHVSANHKANTQATIARHEEKISQGICPRCGGRLTFRNGKYGSFYGCSNYPRCRYTC